MVFSCVKVFFWGCLYGRRDGTLPGRDVKQDLAMHVYTVYLLFVAFCLYGKNFSGTFFVLSRQSGIPVRSTGIPAKAGQFLSYKHSVPLCRDNIMWVCKLSRGKSSRLETFSCKPGLKNVPSRLPYKQPLNVQVICLVLIQYSNRCAVRQLAIFFGCVFMAEVIILYL